MKLSAAALQVQKAWPEGLRPLLLNMGGPSTPGMARQDAVGGAAAEQGSWRYTPVAALVSTSRALSCGASRSDLHQLPVTEPNTKTRKILPMKNFNGI